MKFEEKKETNVRKDGFVEGVDVARIMARDSSRPLNATIYYFDLYTFLALRYTHGCHCILSSIDFHRAIVAVAFLPFLH